MNFRNIEDIKRNINISTITIFIIIISFTTIGLIVIHNGFVKDREIIIRQEIKTAENLYKSNLSEKLSIIANSTVFLDYLRSGDVTRKSLYYRFFTQILSLKSNSISGMKIVDSTGSVIFKSGKSSPYRVSLRLCYLNQELNSIMGDCNFVWEMYFYKDNLLKEIQAINHDIITCNNCPEYNFFEGKTFSSFPITSNSTLKFNLDISDSKDNSFYIYLFLMLISFVIFGGLSWYRISSIINYYIANPIKDITNYLKENIALNHKYEIEEIQYLIDEINIWKSKLNKIQSEEHIARVGKIAAQLAHDVRSPLAAIDMLVRSMSTVPEDCRTTLRSATKRISDIANNFLSQYKKPMLSINNVQLTVEHIPTILEYMISEKRSQYVDCHVNINLLIDDDALCTFSLIDSNDFKRIMSNLIDNSMEAIDGHGYVMVKLSKEDSHLRICIIDDGHGIPPDLLPKIMLGGVSFGKENGLGLGLSHAIKKIEEWQGSINIWSDVGVGTTVKISLPFSSSEIN